MLYNFQKEFIEAPLGALLNSKIVAAFINRSVSWLNCKAVSGGGISTLTTLDELDAVSWNTIQEWLITLRKKGIAVIIVHHAGKTGTQRGISKREDILDLVINLRNKASSNNEEEVSHIGKCQVVFEKNRNLSKKQISNFGIELIDVFDDKIAWIDVYATVLQLKDEGMSCRDIAKLTDISKSRVAEICKLDN